MPETSSFRHGRLKTTVARYVLSRVGRSADVQLAPRTVTSADLDAHFIAVESLMRRAVDHGERVEIDMASPIPGGGYDTWRLTLTCVPWLTERRAEFLLAYSVRLLIDAWEDARDETHETWDDCLETIKIDPDLPNLTAALATWLLRHGWLCSGEKDINGAAFRACEAVDCEFAIVEGRVQVTERFRPLGAPPVAPPHWERAQERRGGPEREHFVPDGWVSPEAEAVAAARNEDHGDWLSVSNTDDPKKH